MVRIFWNWSKIWPVGLAVLALRGSSAMAEEWPTLHKDYQRSGFTTESIKGPYERKWWRDFHDEMIATRCEAIVAEGKVFVGTFAGVMRALDVVDGSTIWSFQADGPIGASPCYRDGRVYFGSDDAFDRGTLYCLRAADGEVGWRYHAAAGFWTSPACDGQNVYLGDRGGRFHAVGIKAGRLRWDFLTGGMVLTPASFSLEGESIIFGSEDMHVYCLAPDGGLRWKTPRLPGLSLRDHGPTIWRGLAIVRTNPADAFHAVLGRNGEMLEAIQRTIAETPDDEVLLDKWGDLLMAPRPERRKAETQGILRYLKENRHDQCFFAFHMTDGSEAWTAPILFTSGLHNPPTPPTFHPETGALFTPARSALTYYVRGVRRYSCLMRLDRESGLPVWFWPESASSGWSAFPLIPDETQALSLMGHRVVGTHQGTIAALDPSTGSVEPIAAARDTYAGIFGPGALAGKFEEAKQLAREGYLTGMPNEWHGPDRAIVAIAEGRIFWIAGSQVVCLAGPEVPRTATGGIKPPAPFPNRLPQVAPGGNVANQGAGLVDRSVEKIAISAEDLRPYLNPPPETPDPKAKDERSAWLSERLESEVLELIRGSNGQPWAPFLVELGISGEERHFAATGLTMQILSRSLPHLSRKTRTAAIDYLDRLAASGSPLEKPWHELEGARREPFQPGPGMMASGLRPPAQRSALTDLYALWAYAHYAHRWPKVDSQKDVIVPIFDAFARNVSVFDPDDMRDDAAQHLNASIAGTLGATRIFLHWGDKERSKQAFDLLADLVTTRVHHERSDHRLVRPTRESPNTIHQAKIPRYVDLVPELSRILGAFGRASLARHIADLQRALPLWYQAYGERMIGGENYISPPHPSRGIFAAWAYGLTAPRQDLAAKLDQPWCRADLYDIEKICAILGASDSSAR